MFPFLDALPDEIRPPLETAAGPLIGLVIALALYLVTAKLITKKRAGDEPATTDEHEDGSETAQRTPIVAPLCAWLGLTIGIALAFLLIYPRESWSDVWWTNDANLRTIHAFAAAALAALLAHVPGALFPRPVAIAWRFLLFAGVGTLGVWLMGSFLVDNDLWTAQKFWTVAGIAGAVTGLLAAIVGDTAHRTDAPSLTTLTASGLLGLSAAPVFFSKSTTMAHTLAAAALALLLIAGASIKWKDLARSSVAPLLAIGVLVPALVIPAVYAEEMLVATLVPLLLAPLVIVLHRTRSASALPGPTWLLPAALQLVALLALVGASTAFATGLLEIHPDQAPWSTGESADDQDADDPYSEYDWYSEE